MQYLRDLYLNDELPEDINWESYGINPDELFGHLMNQEEHDEEIKIDEIPFQNCKINDHIQA